VTFSSSISVSRAGLVCRDILEQYFGIKDHLAEPETTDIQTNRPETITMNEPEVPSITDAGNDEEVSEFDEEGHEEMKDDEVTTVP